MINYFNLHLNIFSLVDKIYSDSQPSAKTSRRHPTSKKQRQQKQNKTGAVEGSNKQSPDRGIVAVIESPEWDDAEDEEINQEIQKAVGHHENNGDEEEEEEYTESDDVGIVRVLPSTSEEETGNVNSADDSLPQVR